MKDKGKMAQKKSTKSKGASCAKLPTGAGGDADRSRAARPSGNSEQQTAQIEARFRAVFESSRDAIGVSKAGIHVFVNPAYLDLFGYRRGTDLAGKPILDLIAPESRDQIKAHIRRRLQGEEVPSSYETRGLRADGSAFDMEVNVSTYHENGAEHTLVILRDITERKQSESALKQSEEKYRGLFEAANDGIFINDAKGFGFIDCNDKGAEMYGLAKEKIIGRSPAQFSPVRQPDGRLSSEVAGEKIRSALNGVPQVFEWQALRADGSSFDVEVTLSRLELGAAVCLQAIVRDISERKRSVEALRASEGRFRRLVEQSPWQFQSSIKQDALSTRTRSSLKLSDTLLKKSLRSKRGGHGPIRMRTHGSVS